MFSGGGHADIHTAIEGEYTKIPLLQFMNLYQRIVSGNARSVVVKKNIIASFLVKGISIVISLLLVPLTLGYVSSELYGIWLTLSSIMLWLNFFDVGFTLGLKNKLTEAIALEQWDRGKALVSTTYFMMVVIFVPLCLLLEAIVPNVDWASFLNVDRIYNPDIMRAMYILVACFCLQMIVNVLTAVVAAFQKVALSSAFPVIGHALSLVVIFILTKCCPPSLYVLSIAISVMPIVVIVAASVILFSSRFKKVAPSVAYVDKKYIKDLFGLGFKFFIIQMQIVIMFQTTNILISKLSGPNDVTAYNIAYKYISVGLMLFNIILSPLWPAFTDAYTRKDYAWMNNIYSKMKKLWALTAVAIVGMVLVSPLVYGVWIGDKAEIPLMMTIVVAVYTILHSWDSLQVILINGIGCVKLQSYITVVGLICHIPLSFLLGKYIGAYGVLASMSMIVVIYLIAFTTQVHKILNQKAHGIWLE